jgi:hypothetical protein
LHAFIKSYQLVTSQIIVYYVLIINKSSHEDKILLTADDFIKIINALPKIPALLEEYQVSSISISPTQFEDDRILIYAFLYHNSKEFSRKTLCEISFPLLELLGQSPFSEAISLEDRKKFTDEIFDFRFQPKELFLVQSSADNMPKLATSQEIQDFAKREFNITVLLSAKKRKTSEQNTMEHKEHPPTLFNGKQKKRRNSVAL